MSKFKIGDKVRRIGWNTYQMQWGDINTLRGFDRYGDLDFVGLKDFGYSADNFELVEENMNKQFTKADLVAGKHVVQMKDSENLYLLANIGDNVLAFEVGGSSNPYCGVWFEDLKNDLTYPHNRDSDVVKVFEFKGSARFGVSVDSLHLIWQRQGKSPEQLQLEELEKQQREIADKIAALSKKL